jgi:hypothetical protein
MGMVFACSQGMVSQVVVLSKALTLENSPSGILCLTLHGMNPFFSHMLYLMTSQRTKLRDVRCFKNLELNEDHCKIAKTMEHK